MPGLPPGAHESLPAGQGGPAWPVGAADCHQCWPWHQRPLCRRVPLSALQRRPRLIPEAVHASPTCREFPVTARPDYGWQADALCLDRPDVAFFPPATGDNGRPTGPAWNPGPALAVCAECPVRPACRAWAEHNRDIVDGVAIHGVVGGVGMVSRRAPGPKAPLMPCGTRAAYVRHLRYGEDPCGACGAANAVHGRTKDQLRRAR